MIQYNNDEFIDFRYMASDIRQITRKGKHKPLLSELLRPQRLGDLTIPQRQIDRLQQMIDARSIMNMCFYGRPGIGKTSAARVIINEMVASNDSTEINGSSATGVDYVRDHIERYASSLPMFGGPKICIIDEADYLSKQAQAALRHVIENMSRNVRFIFTANDRSKLASAIQSRMFMICFDLSGPDIPQVQKRLVRRYKETLANAGIAFDGANLRQLVDDYFPDLRQIANAIEFEFGGL